jgi:hypothetical protein
MATQNRGFAPPHSPKQVREAAKADRRRKKQLKRVEKMQKAAAPARKGA